MSDKTPARGVKARDTDSRRAHEALGYIMRRYTLETQFEKELALDRALVQRPMNHCRRGNGDSAKIAASNESKHSWYSLPDLIAIYPRWGQSSAGGASACVFLSPDSAAFGSQSVPGVRWFKVQFSRGAGFAILSELTAKIEL